MQGWDSEGNYGTTFSNVKLILKRGPLFIAGMSVGSSIEEVRLHQVFTISGMSAGSSISEPTLVEQ